MCSEEAEWSKSSQNLCRVSYVSAMRCPTGIQEVAGKPGSILSLATYLL